MALILVLSVTNRYLPTVIHIYPVDATPEVSFAFLAACKAISKTAFLIGISAETTLMGSVSLIITMTHVIQSLSMLLDIAR